ncbi:Ig-like domain repeat protein [Nocardioides ganghwensis]|uniref:Ig-like domain repeat protein n=1 Tax=Nocardioides ganghwensis TaxID=252230 RepID=A0A4Q2S8X9_9ACTN|nr:Ig-like domain repeat protein [Nocardioides ganghwensis]MBD3948140.1 Ig-like domain repeat protein [Nocardioides ganghwensis]RYB96922.1 Ig-like domain repeat protein [Nocardioides ganghwensis]
MSRSTHRATVRLRIAAALTLGLVAATFGQLSSASAVPPDMPTGLSANQPDSTTTILSWEHVPNATRYAVTVNGITTNTVNNSFVPTQALPEGNLDWSVTAFTGSEGGAPAFSTFSSTRLAAPVLTSPTSNAVLAQPTNPPLLTWSPSAGATSYKVEVDGDADFVGASSWTTTNTSLVVPLNLGDGDWFWRVTASKGGSLNSPVSEERRFVVSPLAAPTITSPPDDSTQTLQDVVLDWTPVPGAASYDVQVSTEADFSQGAALTDNRTGILGTRYSPAITYDNKSYFWRVRAIDMSGQATPWTAARFSFTRNWPQRPAAVYPAGEGAEEVPAPLYFQWSPVPHASEYEFQLGTQANFSVGTFASCRVAGTTFTPGMFAVNTTGILAPPRVNEDCIPQAGEINYWRVRGLDRPFTKSGDIPGVQGLFSDTQAFTYMPLSVTNMSPRNGALVDVPTLTWDTAVGAESYEISIRKANGNVVITKETSATSYTPSGSRLNPADGPFTWRITALGADRSRSVTYVNQFNVTGNDPTSDQPALTPLTPTSTTTGIMTAPSLTWSPMPAAHHYAVNVGNSTDGSQVWFGHTSDDLFGQPMPYPAMTDTSTRLLLPGDYDWQVTAYNADNEPIATGPEGTFTVEEIRATTGHALAQGGQQLDVNYDGTKNPCTPTTGGCTVPSTPVLSWTPDPRASHYMVYVASDPSFTNLLEPSNAVPATRNTMYAPALDNRAHTYPDSQAGQSYYWHIRPCRTRLNCGPDPVSQTDVAQGTFKKRSPEVQGLTSTSPTGTEITFSWTDYWATNQEQPWAQTAEIPNQSAKQYRIEVDDDASFAGTLIDSALVDQTTYTSSDDLYPEGTLYWRVQAVDSDDNGLAWSEVQTFTKQSPQVNLTAPINNAGVAGTVPFRWASQAFAKSYDIEVYANDDSTFSTANRVTYASASNLRNAAFVPAQTLPASDAFYLWRVRRTDADNNKGPWSVGGRFKVTAGAVQLLTPALGGSTPPNGAVLQWSQITGAATYAVTLSPPSGVPQTFVTAASAYAPLTNLVSGTYQWTVTARDASGNAIGSASSSFTVNNQLQASLRPVIETPEGTGLGKTLTLSAPAWTPAGVSVTTTYQWQRDGMGITGATGTSYTLVNADFGKSITVKATGKAPGYLDGVSTSLPISPTSGDAIANVTPPSITGSPVAVGNRLTGNRGTWPTTYGSMNYTYAWLRDGAPIAGQTTMYYTPVAADVGTDIIFRVTASATGYTDGVAQSNPVRVETLAPLSGPQVGAPSGTGVGAGLVGQAPAWNQPDVTTTYQWLRSGTAILGATTLSYTLTVNDLGKEISLRAIGKKSGFQDSVAVSNVVVATAGGALQATVQPVITGTATAGSNLKVEPGTWSQPSPTFRYQWLRDGVPIPNATSVTYRLSPEDAGKNVSVTVLASKTGFADGSANAAAVAVARLKSTVAGALKASRIKVGTRAKLNITVTVAGLSTPTGVVQVLDKGKKIAQFTMAPVHKGKKTLKLRKLPKGKHRLQVVYLGNGQTFGSKSKRIILYVVK